MNRKRVLVTGGGGAIGRFVVPYLMRTVDVVSLDLKPVEAAAESLVGSVTDLETVMQATENIDAVFHMAYAHTDFEDLANQIDVNLKGATNVLEACVARRIPRVVFASTVMTAWALPEFPATPAYHNFEPVNFYSYTKCCQELLAEMYSRQHGLSVICLRIGQPMRVEEDPTRFGPRFGMTRDAEVLIAYDDLCEAVRLALLEAPGVKFESLFLTGDYGDNHYFVDKLKEILGLRFQWRVRPDPEIEGAFLFEREEWTSSGGGDCDG